MLLIIFKKFIIVLILETSLTMFFRQHETIFRLMTVCCTMKSQLHLKLWFNLMSLFNFCQFVIYCQSSHISCTIFIATNDYHNAKSTNYNWQLAQLCMKSWHQLFRAWWFWTKKFLWYINTWLFNCVEHSIKVTRIVQ